MLLHDNARPHTADRTVQLLQEFHWEIFDHPPYSPDLAPSDYHLFMHLKKWLASQRFETDDELQTGVNEWFKTLAADFFDTGIKNRVPRYQKCVEVNGTMLRNNVNVWFTFGCNKSFLSMMVAF